MRTTRTTRGREALALEVETMHARVAGQVTNDDVVELLVEQLAALVVGLALHRGDDVDKARGLVVARLAAAIVTMAADTAIDDAAAAARAAGSH